MIISGFGGHPNMTTEPITATLMTYGTVSEISDEVAADDVTLELVKRGEAAAWLRKVAAEGWQPIEEPRVEVRHSIGPMYVEDEDGELVKLPEHAITVGGRCLPAWVPAAAVATARASLAAAVDLTVAQHDR
jgi:hypothetical protein